MNVIILEVPSNTEFASLPQDVQDAIRGVDGDFIRDIMPGTRIFARYSPGSFEGKKIINSVVYAGLEQIEAMIASFEFCWDWAVLAMQSALKVPQFDEDGEPIIDPETGLQVYAVDVYRQLPLSFIDYCADIYDGEGNFIRPTTIPPLAKFGGHENWVLP